jgi:aldose 1-epimerase
MKINKNSFGFLPSGEEIFKFTLITNNDMSVDIINYGCTITSIKVPDRNSNAVDVVLGYNSLDEYLKSPFYFGALIGPVAGRISNGCYSIAGKLYNLEKNENDITHLHGGLKGLDKVAWKAKEISDNSSVGIEFSYVYIDPKKGYPGEVAYKFKCILTNEYKLILSYYAESDESTPINLTNHSYFNLNGENSSKNILNQEIKVNSNYFLPLDENNIPTGEVYNVKKTPFDFTSYKKFESVISSDYHQTRQAGGFDHPILLNHEVENIPQISAYNPDNGIKLDVYTDQPCLVLYTCNGMDSSFTGKSNALYSRHYAFCFEAQGIPDALNNRHFESVLIEKNKPYIHRTEWKFTVD